MLNYIRENIDNVQELAKQKLNLLLIENGYCLSRDDHNIEGIETRQLQWINDSKNHTVELIWDGKEDWFYIGEFASTKNLNYISADHIKIVPFNRTKMFNRNNYTNNVVDLIIDAIKEKINAPTPKPHLNDDLVTKR